MALSYLLIETLESFYRGWLKSPNSALAFCSFFDRHATLFPEFKGFAQGFFENVRRGILHQGETLRGWHLTSKDELPIFNPAPHPTIHAIKFNQHMGMAVDEYSGALESAPLTDDLWKNFIKKMNSTIKHCG